MGENETVRVQQAIGQNMSNPSQLPFAMTPEEMAFTAQPPNTRIPRRSGRSVSADNMFGIINSSKPLRDTGNIMVIQRLGESNKHRRDWMENIDQIVVTSNQQNNKVLSEDIDTLRENLKNNRETLKKRNSETCLTIEQASRGRSRSIGTIDPMHLKALSVNNIHSSGPMSAKFYISNSKDSLNDSTDDLRKPFSPNNDPSGVDLPNRCRKFYFCHQKSLEGVKQTVRSSKHKRARDKMDGKPCSGLDLAMDRLSSEMVRQDMWVKCCHLELSTYFSVIAGDKFNYRY